MAGSALNESPPMPQRKNLLLQQARGTGGGRAISAFGRITGLSMPVRMFAFDDEDAEKTTNGVLISGGVNSQIKSCTH